MPRVGAEPAGGGRRRRRRRRGQAASEREALAALQRLVSADSAAALRIAIDDATPHAGAIDALEEELYVACQQGHVDIVRLLLEAGAAMDQAMQTGATSLLIACQEGLLEVAKLLSSYGASRAATPFRGTPEEVANRAGHADLAACLVASRGWTPLAHLETLTAARATSLLRSASGWIGGLQ